MTCYAAVAEMLTGGEITQQQMVDQLGLDGAESGETARAMPPGWEGGSVADVDTRDQVFAALNTTGSWGAVLRGAGGGLHMVVVDGVTADGRVRIRDPWHGSSYETPYEEFVTAWVGEAVFNR